MILQFLLHLSASEFMNVRVLRRKNAALLLFFGPSLSICHCHSIFVL